ncbi:MAG: gamma-glutamylcyclotransferase [Proteobacteria bacterium]|nr:gamma-glutamylcyclotransferase [Pseudomonadota bacterium]
MSTYSVFTYGTLQVPVVMHAVTGKELKPVAATLVGYQCFKFREKTFPGIIKNSTCTIDGMLYRNIDQQTLERIDQFEDVAYERCMLDVQVGDKTEQAFVYVTRDEYRKWLSDEEWDLVEFEREHLEKYLKRIAGL